MRRFACVVAAVTLLLAAGCGDEKDASADRDIATTTAQANLTTTTAQNDLTTTETTTGITTETTSVLAACVMERRTTRTANAAHNLVHGQYATSIDDLVGEFLREEPTYWTIVPGKAEPVARPDTDLPAGCSDGSGATAAPSQQ